MKKVTRPLLRWHGGKWLLAPWIIQHLPAHRRYCEPYGGAGSVLLRKKPAHSEIYNDLDDLVVNLFQVLRGPRANELIEALRLTPFARKEFDLAYEVAIDPVEEARRLVIRSFMGFGSDGFNRDVTTGFRAYSDRSCTTPAHDWANYPLALRGIVERLRSVVIESRPALDVMRTADEIFTLHYVDPPYLPETRSSKSRKCGGKYHAYRHEMTEQDHRELLDFLPTLRGMVVLSGYPSPLYDQHLKGWIRVERAALADGARQRIECLWLNSSAVEAKEGELFKREA
ncbi:MAG: DNA adenine methylase [Planctomycetota bacterium]|nr:DNA adenine methylase [Planctomycetota bacterium]